MKKHITKTRIFLMIILILAILIGRYFYNNTHWWEKDLRSIKKAGAVEKQITLPNGNIINYGEIENDHPALLLIHGQMVSWEAYAEVLPDLSKNWHVYAIDVYGHGQSSHDESLYYIDVNGDDLIWFINNVIAKETLVSGHSNGALTAAYIAAYGGDLVTGVVLEDPPVFSTQGEGWEETFAYIDTYALLHEYNQTKPDESWEAYYLRRCLWGQLFMKDAMDGIANYAERYHQKHPDDPVEIFFLPKSMTRIFQYADDYDLDYGEKFYDLTWNNGIMQEDILKDISIPCVYIHAKESVAETGTYLCAATREQAERAVAYIGDHCTLIETDTSDHTIHQAHKNLYLEVINGFLND